MEVLDYHDRVIKLIREYERMMKMAAVSLADGPVARLVQHNMRVMHEQWALAEKLARAGTVALPHNLSPGTMAAALKAVDALVRPPDALLGLGELVLANQAQWSRLTLASIDIDSLAAAQQVAQAHFSDIATASVLSSERLATLDWSRVGVVPQLDSELAQILRSGFVGLAASSTHLYAGLERDPAVFAALPPAATRFPVMEILREVEVLRAFTLLDWTDVDEPESDAFEERVTCETSGAVDSLLEQLDPALLTPWKGAKAAVDSANPDRGRHVCVSVRELTTHVLHRVAPDDRVIAWVEDTHLLHDGRPTRRARLLYLCRGVNHEPLSDFVETDITSHICFLDAIQRGTHGLTFGATDQQVRALLNRAETLLLFVLRLNEAEEM
jgi:hypothetical protein